MISVCGYTYRQNLKQIIASISELQRLSCSNSLRGLFLQVLMVMADSRDGCSFFVPPCRRLTWDLLAFNRTVPQCAHDRLFDLGRLADARQRSQQRVSWPALFLKAYGLLAQEYSALRQTWYPWPVAHLYQHPVSVGVVTVQREYKGVPWLFWGRIPCPEQLSLFEIQKQIDSFQHDPVRKVFGQEIKMAKLPTVIRRLIWGWNLRVCKQRRAERLGTFFLSTLSGQGVEIQVPPSIQTGCLTYGPLGSEGTTRVTIAYDHRVMDGAYVASCLTSLESILSETLRQEVLQPGTSAGNIPSAA